MESLITWLAQPVSGAQNHFISFEHQWHARFMTLSWGVLIPLGIVIARYYKVLPTQRWPEHLDNQFWWKSHLCLQISGCLLSVPALWLVADWTLGGDTAARTLHEWLGWSIVLFSITQLMGGALRGTKGDVPLLGDPGVAEKVVSLDGDHYLMTRRRCLFEYVHKVVGYLALVLACANILLGLAVADAPRWMWLLLIGFWSALLVLSIVLQKQGRCVDTYQAIYGPEPALPGNQRPPIGFGVRRYAAQEWPPVRRAPSRRAPVQGKRGPADLHD